MRRKGVVLDWDQQLDLMEMVEAIAIKEKEAIVCLERMKTRYMDQVTKDIKEKYLDKIIVTFEGEYLPARLGLYRNTIYLKVRPFIEPVKQCFNCFKFRHKKEWCKGEKKCINCGEKEHGRCEENPRCANCLGMHKATFKRCPDYEVNWQLKKIMAEENVSIYEAKEIWKNRLLHNECIDIPSTKDFPELRKKDPVLEGYKYRNEDNDT